MMINKLSEVRVEQIQTQWEKIKEVEWTERNVTFKIIDFGK